MVFVEGGAKETVRNIPTPKADRERFCITDEDVLELADYAIKIERHYGRPMDMEWAKDGIDGKIYVVQARPETVASQRRPTLLESYTLARDHGERAGRGPCGRREDRVGHGAADHRRRAPRRVPARRGAGRRHDDARLGAGDEDRRRDRHQPRRADLPRRHHRPRARRAGRRRHRRRDDASSPAARRSRSRAPRATPGTSTRVQVPFEVRTPRSGTSRARRRRSWSTSATRTSRSRPRSCPTTASAWRGWSSSSPSRSRPIRWRSCIPSASADPQAREAIDRLIRRYPDGETFFVERLSEGIGTIAAAFWPKPVVVRMSDFKTNEYASLLGGADFEPHEENPMLGFRGASRYAHPAYAEGFALECRAMTTGSRGHGAHERDPDDPVRAPGGRRPSG